MGLMSECLIHKQTQLQILKSQLCIKKRRYFFATGSGPAYLLIFGFTEHQVCSPTVLLLCYNLNNFILADSTNLNVSSGCVRYRISLSLSPDQVSLRTPQSIVLSSGTTPPPPPPAGRTYNKYSYQQPA